MTQQYPPLADAPLLEGMSLQIVVPADARLLRVVRLVTSGVASLGPFDLDSVEEARVAVDELTSALIRAGNGDPLTLDFELDDTALRVDGSTALANGSSLEIEALSQRILEAVTSSHEWATVDGVAHIRLVKHLTPGRTPPP